MSALRQRGRTHHPRSGGGIGQIFVPASQLVIPTSLVPGDWVRGVPSVVGLGGPAPTGLATCSNLCAYDAPTLLEAYELEYATIGWGVTATAFASGPTVSVELQILVGGEPRYVVAQVGQTMAPATQTAYQLSGVWTADLVNKVFVQPGQSLAIQIGASFSVQTGSGSSLTIGAQINSTGNITPYPSVIHYSVVALG